MNPNICRAKKYKVFSKNNNIMKLYWKIRVVLKTLREIQKKQTS